MLLACCCHWNSSLGRKTRAASGALSNFFCPSAQAVSKRSIKARYFLPLNMTGLTCSQKRHVHTRTQKVQSILKKIKKVWSGKSHFMSDPKRGEERPKRWPLRSEKRWTRKNERYAVKLVQDSISGAIELTGINNKLMEEQGQAQISFNSIGFSVKRQGTAKETGRKVVMMDSQSITARHFICWHGTVLKGRAVRSRGKMRKGDSIRWLGEWERMNDK